MVCLIVPFRKQREFDREGHLRDFLAHMAWFVEAGNHIIVVEQTQDQRRFNRGMLLNVGTRCCDDARLILHDVDLLPHTALQPAYLDTEGAPVLHLGKCWPRYANNPKYTGGVLAIDRDVFTRANGFPNSFWGWGGEDDALRWRLDRIQARVDAPAAGPSYRDLEGVSLERKLKVLRDGRLKCMNKWELLAAQLRTWRQDGVSDVDYHVVQSTAVAARVMRYTVHLLPPRAPPPREKKRSRVCRDDLG
jgi:hypothetical protein